MISSSRKKRGGARKKKNLLPAALDRTLKARKGQVNTGKKTSWEFTVSARRRGPREEGIHWGKKGALLSFQRTFLAAGEKKREGIDDKPLYLKNEEKTERLFTEGSSHCEEWVRR